MMLSVYNIWTIARVETKTLLRSWFFRVLSLLALGLLIVFNIPLYTEAAPTPWVFRGISSAIPYVNILFLNVVQAIVAVFLASDFLKRDRKLDTTEVIYMRSMTNGDYVLGKTFGIMFVFLVLNLVILTVAAIFNIFFAGVPFIFRAYLFYPLLVSVPTLVFILGLSFLMMVLIRNQPATFIVLLGYIASTLFFFGPRYNHILDYMTFHTPLMYSTIVGFGDIAGLLLHRGIYLSLGLAFIFFTIVMIRRLPQSRSITIVSRVLAVALIAAAAVMVHLRVSGILRGRELRRDMVELAGRSGGEPGVSIEACALDLKHTGAGIEGTAGITVLNRAGIPLERYVFSLNPGLRVTGVECGGGCGFERELHILTVIPAQPLVPGGRDSVIISYRGSIDEDACYLDIDEESRAGSYRAAFLNIAKRHAFITPGFVLLTPENMWYPSAGVHFNPGNPLHHTVDFIDFTLNVTTEEGLTAVSQGRPVRNAPGSFTFVPERPLPCRSLAIGRYERRTITADSLEYNLYLIEGHDYFSEYFTEIGDTIPSLIAERKQDFENKLGLHYPYPRLSLVEAPVQFYSYPRLWTAARETVQPGMVFLPERGVMLHGADFRMTRNFQKRAAKRGRGETRTEREQQIDLFNGFINRTLAGNISRRRFRPGGINLDSSMFNLYPNYFYFVHHVASDTLAVFNAAIESFISDPIVEPSSYFAQMFQGLTSEEKVNLALAERNFSQILSTADDEEMFNDIVKIKGRYLFLLVQHAVGEEAFMDHLHSFLGTNRFRTVDTGELFSGFRRDLGFDVGPHVERWFHGKEQAGYLLADVNACKVLDSDRTRFQVTFKVSNVEPVDGLIQVTFMEGGRRFRRFTGNLDEIKRTIVLGADQTKEVGFVLDFQPRTMSVNTMISKNLPSILNTVFEKFELNEKAEPFDGERIVEVPVVLREPNEIVVDNEDPGCEAQADVSQSVLKRLFKRTFGEEEDKYIGIEFWSPPGTWKASVFSEFHGDLVRSALYTKAGKGDRKVTWNAEIERSGYYDIYFYVSKLRRPGRRGKQGKFGHYHFIIQHDDGVDEPMLDIGNAGDGWNSLGAYYLSKGATSVVLTNESDGGIIIADAVKWVPAR